MEKEIKIWCDKEGDYLEVILDRKSGHSMEAENNSVIKKVDESGSIIGFSILNVSTLKRQRPLSVGLAGHIT
jgi:2,3-bisphosphoglycerate-independent phosphoglycerate mutase